MGSGVGSPDADMVQFPGAAEDEESDAGDFVGAADADVVQPACNAEGDGAGLVDAVTV